MSRYTFQNVCDEESHATKHLIS